MIKVLRFAVKNLLYGSKEYYIWFSILFILGMLGLNAYAKQLAYGLITTGMGDEVSWGFYIANFVYLVGMAAAAVMLVIPSYIFKDKDIHNVVIFAELFAVAALIMCLMFITVDVGRPDRLWHMIPFIGKFHWPSSMLTWDFLVLNGYLAINVYVCVYFLYKKIKKEDPKRKFYLFIIFLSILWAPSIHTVTGFLFQGLAGRPFWHTGLIAPRFLASAFAAGPAFILIVFRILENKNLIHISRKVYDRIRIIITVSLIINIVFLISEIFSELYQPTEHSSNIMLLLGFKGSTFLTPFIWLSFILLIVALLVLLSPMRQDIHMLMFASGCIVIGIWLEKGLGFLIPAFIPSTIGDLVQYKPTLNELLIVMGIWATGFLLYTVFLKLAIPILNGKFEENV